MKTEKEIKEKWNAVLKERTKYSKSIEELKAKNSEHPAEKEKLYFHRLSSEHLLGWMQAMEWVLQQNLFPHKTD